MPDPAAKLSGRRLFVFDLDGTLADTSPIHATAFAAALAPLGIAVDYPAIAGLATANAMRKLLEDAGQAVDEATIAALVEAKRAAARERLASVRPLPGAREFLAQAARAHRLALCTSAARETAVRTLSTLAFAQNFDPLVTADDTAKAKPAPDAFLTVLAQAGVSAADALVFEDSEAGLAAAAAAGIETIRIGGEGHAWADLTACLAGATA
ncbi:HAD family hydrolase [Novosphingobium aquimarinum]|uniref:HAD family hydrolase n=1 Tax=Novosphingobium aquimarinum TaxID=2682494 RepID=UPI0018DD7526|nr:HAD-IA family hydrolase [Novosphingobium aquimarinum]